MLTVIKILIRILSWVAGGGSLVAYVLGYLPAEIGVWIVGLSLPITGVLVEIGDKLDDGLFNKSFKP